jgi:hypothetical protein
MALVVAAAAAHKAKLQAKGKLRPHAMVRKKLPDGADLIDKLPERRTGAHEDDEEADAAYCAAIAKVSDVFGKINRSQTTADEHKMYTRIIDGWLVRKGFGSYFEAVLGDDGRCIAVRPRKREDGTLKVLKPEMIVGHLLEMSAGSKHTPKGGHAADIAARAAMEVATACGPRSKMKCAARHTNPSACAASERGRGRRRANERTNGRWWPSRALPTAACAACVRGASCAMRCVCGWCVARQAQGGRVRLPGARG